MARAYSLDLRERVVGAVAAGQSCRSLAKTFMVSVASVVKWSQRYRATGTAAAKPMGGHRQRILRSERDWLLARIAEKPDLTLRAVLAELAVRGMVVSYGAVWPPATSSSWTATRSGHLAPGTVTAVHGPKADMTDVLPRFSVCRQLHFSAAALCPVHLAAERVFWKNPANCLVVPIG